MDLTACNCYLLGDAIKVIGRECLVVSNKLNAAPSGTAMFVLQIGQSQSYLGGHDPLLTPYVTIRLENS